MKEEPMEVKDEEERRVNGIDYYDESVAPNYRNFVPTDEEEIDIKFVFPTATAAVPVNPLGVEETGTDTDNELETSSVKPDHASDFHFNHDNDAQAEIDETAERIIDEADVDVHEMKPIMIPIPIIRPAEELGSNDNQIIINHHKKQKTSRRPKPCICSICNTGFPNKQLFQLHMSNDHADKLPYPCSHCGKRFGLLSSMRIHETIHDPNRFQGEPKFACDLCDRKFHLKVTLKGHRRKVHLGYQPPKGPSNTVIRQHHAVGVKNHRAPEKEVKIFECPHCDLKFAMRCMLGKHLTCHTKEKPYRCEECGQTFSLQSSLTFHMRARHLNPSSKSPRPSRPKFMSNQPCPCTICGKVFKVPSQLQKHVTLHTGEKPHECLECGQRFRIKEDLKKHHKRLHVVQRQVERLNTNETYKCLICGKDDFLVFSDLRNHRRGPHRHIPLPADSEREMPFGCGICGKPWSTRGQAMVCALLRHDPTSLLKAMFRFKCPRCPEEESFGFHSTLALRKHWEKEHPDKPLPVQYRAPSGLYNGRHREDTLPSVTINKELAKRIREYGPEVESQFPLYIEFDLFPIKNKFCQRKRKRQGIKSVPKEVEKNFTCDICGTTIVHRRNFKKHVRLHEEGQIRQKCATCGICGKRLQNLKTLRLHEQQQHKKETAAEGKTEVVNRTTPMDDKLEADPSTTKRRSMKKGPENLEQQQQKEKSDVKQVKKGFTCDICGARIVHQSSFKRHVLRHSTETHPQNSYNNSCGVCGKRFLNAKTLRLHERQQHKQAKTVIELEGKVDELVQVANQTRGFRLARRSVNVNDPSAVQNILGNRAISIVLSRT